MTIADINTYTRFLCRTDATNYTAANLLITVNQALEELVGLIINADGTWEYDDTNYTDLPVGTGTLVEAQESYSFASEYLQVQKVKVADNNGDWHVVLPLDQFSDSDFLGNAAIEEAFTATGLPEYYDILGDSIRLYPAPTSTRVTLTGGTSGGIKVHFKRTADLYTSAQVTTGTKEPGLPSPYHQLVCFMAAVPYCVNRNPSLVPWLEKKIDEGKKELIKHFGQREKDRRKVMTTKKVKFR